MRMLSAALALACTACASSDVSSAGRGTAACHEWQDSVCDWAERCEVLERARCDEQFQAVTCRSDDLARSCAEAYDGASCVQPRRCGVDDVADPAPAARACDRLVSRFCKRAIACDAFASPDECEAEIRASIDCSRMVGYTLSYEDCLGDVAELECNALRLPATCAGVFIPKLAGE